MAARGNRNDKARDTPTVSPRGAAIYQLSDAAPRPVNRFAWTAGIGQRLPETEHLSGLNIRRCNGLETVSAVLLS